MSFATGPIAAQAHLQSASSAVDKEFQAAMAAREQGDLDRAKAIPLGLRRSRPGIFAIDESLGLICVSQQHEQPPAPDYDLHRGCAELMRHRGMN
jgi:hypothetical protein